MAFGVMGGNPFGIPDFELEYAKTDKEKKKILKRRKKAYYDLPWYIRIFKEKNF